MEALQEAVELIARALAVEHVTVLELAPRGDDVRLRAGVGWEEGAIGHTVDAMPGGYELIDYKTGRPKSAAQLREDVQLSLYAVGARESWQLEAAQQAYYYVLDDEKVPVERSEEDRDWSKETVLAVAEGIQSQGFEPTPSYAACSMCDYRLACPAAER